MVVCVSVAEACWERRASKSNNLAFIQFQEEVAAPCFGEDDDEEEDEDDDPSKIAAPRPPLDPLLLLLLLLLLPLVLLLFLLFFESFSPIRSTTADCCCSASSTDEEELKKFAISALPNPKLPPPPLEAPEAAPVLPLFPLICFKKGCFNAALGVNRGAVAVFTNTTPFFPSLSTSRGRNNSAARSHPRLSLASSSAVCFAEIPDLIRHSSKSYSHRAKVVFQFRNDVGERRKGSPSCSSTTPADQVSKHSGLCFCHSNGDIAKARGAAF